MKRRLASWLLGLILGLGFGVSMGKARAESWNFALIGDVPYSDQERAELPKLLAALGHEHLSLIAHIGDIKHGKERCDDGLYQDRLQLFQASPAPFVYVPGDNDWTDCHRASNGSYDPQERLEKLRQVFWTDDFSLGKQRLKLERQTGEWREHSRFRLGPVLFLSLNLPGGNNNWGKTDVPSQEYQHRNPAVIQWLTDSFALARREKLQGVVVLMQADPGFKHFSQGLGHIGYRQFLETLRRETEHFGGQVVTVHGDTHQARVDQPLRDLDGRKLAQFTRVETYGYPIMGWVKGRIDTESPELFHFEIKPWPPAP